MGSIGEREEGDRVKTMQGFISHGKELGYYFKDSGKSLKSGFKYSSDMMSSVSVEGRRVENGRQG